MASKLTDAQKAALDTVIALAKEDGSFIEAITHALDTATLTTETVRTVGSDGIPMAVTTFNDATVTNVAMMEATAQTVIAAAGGITARALSSRLRRGKGLALRALIDYRNSMS